jgi:hypothetical protein
VELINLSVEHKMHNGLNLIDRAERLTRDIEHLKTAIAADPLAMRYVRALDARERDYAETMRNVIRADRYRDRDEA